MGLSSLTLCLVFSLSAMCRATMTCTITLLPSLADPGGDFDVPKAKCPPDRGSSVCVTGRPAPNSIISPRPLMDVLESEKQYSNACIPISNMHGRPNIIPSPGPQPIPTKTSLGGAYGLVTPPLTPPGYEDAKETDAGVPPKNKDSLDLLLTLFPRNGLAALPHAKSVSVTAPGMDATFDGVVLEMPGSERTLYVDGKSTQAVSFRESVVALFDLASEQLDCPALVIALDRSSPSVRDLLHSLMYVGGTVVTRPPFEVDPAYILVGFEL